MSRRNNSGMEISLFPFLSILVCVIGVLTLMIIGSSLGQVTAAPDPDAVERTSEYRELEQRLLADRKVISTKQANLDSSGFGQARLESARRDLGELEKKTKERQAAMDESSKALPLVRERELLNERIKQLEKDLADRTQLISTLDADIEKKGRPPEAAVSIRPTGTGLDIEPVFIECSDTSLVIHEGEEPTRVRAEDVAADPTLLKVLDRVSEDDKSVVIFLVRDNGTNTYWAARGVAESRGARNGKIPVLGQGRIDLSLIQKRKRGG